MNILIIIISLFLGVFAGPAFAQEEVNEIVIIDSVATEGIYIGQSFPVGINIVGAEPNAVFFYKFYGGIDNTISSIQNNPSLTKDSDWSAFPTVVTDGDGNAYIDTSAYIDSNQPSGIYNLYVRLAYPESEGFYSPAEYKSVAQEITILYVQPTTTPTSVSPTSTPTTIPTLTRKPSPTPHNQAPALTPTPTINMSIFGVTTDSTASATPTEDYSLVSTETSSSTFIETGSNSIVENKENLTAKKSNLIPLIFISLSGLFLIVPLILMKRKFKSECPKK